MKADLIAFTGYARCGKDEAARPLIRAGYERQAFGDIIKGIFDEQCRQFLDFSAFTDDTEKKKLIRPLLEQGGEVFYDHVFNTFFSQLKPGRKVVNTRLCRVREALEWRKRGGVIIELRRVGNKPTTAWEQKQLKELYDQGLVDDLIVNGGTVADLHEQVRRYFKLPPPGS